MEKEHAKIADEVNRLIAEVKRITTEKDELVRLVNEGQALIEQYATSKTWRLARFVQKLKIARWKKAHKRGSGKPKN